MRFSLMIAVYNAEPYLEACLQSVLAQTFTDFELLLIDDGSTDGSGEVCDRFAEADARVRVRHTENHGVFFARALAESLAAGEYLLHFDADDLVDPTLLASLSAVIDRQYPDLVFFDFSTFRGEDAPVEIVLLPRDATFTGDGLRELYRLLLSTRFNTLCDKCFHRRLIDCAPDYAQYPGLRHGEDLLRSAYLVTGAESACYLRRSFYYYRRGVGHTERFDPNSLGYYDRIAACIRALLTERGAFDGEMRALLYKMGRFQLDNYIRLLAASRTPLREGARLLRAGKDTALFRHAMTDAPRTWKYRLLRSGRYRTLLVAYRLLEVFHAQ